ncbi:MAG: acylphosphatase [Phycisphaerales bacterium]
MRTHVVFAGRVQGVGFRATARSIASQFPITGWVRNEADRSVTLEAQGAPEAVRAFLDTLGETMQHHIRSNQEMDVPEVAGEIRFEILR